MGGRDKARGDYAGQYSIETVDFWLADPRVLGLTMNDRGLLFHLGILALKERRECLPSSYSWAVCWRYAGGSMEHCRRDLGDCRRRLAESKLIDETTDGRIIVCGARKRRPNFTWRDAPDIAGINGYSSHQAVSSKQEAVKETEESAAEGRDSQLPKKGKMKAFQGKDGRWLVQEVEVA